MPLLVPWWYLRYRTFVYFACATGGRFFLFRSSAFLPQVSKSPFLKPSVVKPDVVVPAILGELVFILYTPFSENRGFKGGTSAVLLLEFGVRSVEAR